MFSKKRFNLYEIVISYLVSSIDNVYENLEDYNPTKKRRVLIVFDDYVTGMECNKKLSPVIIELFLRGRKLNISLVLNHNLISKCLKL